MLRILVVAAVLLGVAYFYLNQGSGENARPLEAQQEALEKARQVEKTVQDQADALRKQIDEQTADDDGQS
jgi:CHASE3 domain sensor protein